ncbi:hypothetical protein ASG60_08025 [Methylobacterium sp. Leaf469]|uniref:AAA family ATPase n=1 Tax=Methylobacterium sp. Leaf469 TaxID=1736387 RepID=UPI0006F2EC82|nr:AAA family ATPase [Methylobacterium sp. Leaf469]KQT93311.1 hypothetical protein ASG60_08025 [Methylobacterium sp. Leaf469]
MSDDQSRADRRRVRIATYSASEARHRRAMAIPSDRVPTVEELIGGAAPWQDSPTADATRWASDLVASPERERLPQAVLAALVTFGEVPRVETAHAVERACLAHIAAFEPSITTEDLVGEIADRATIYGALFGNPAAAGRAVAILHDAVHSYLYVAHSDPVPLREVVVTLLHMASLCSRDLPERDVGNDLQVGWSFGRANARDLLRTLADVARPPSDLAALEDLPPAGEDEREPVPAADILALAAAAQRAAPGVVVIPEAGSGKKHTGQAKELAGKRLPLRLMPNLEELGRSLTARRPWLVQPISRVLSVLAGRETVSLPNLLLVGLPGGGKTALAQDLADGLGVPSIVYGCAGISDASALGTSKQWSSARPSIFTQLLMDHGCGNGIVTLDELDKAGATGGHNGSLREGLISVGEIAARRRFFDLGIDGVVDISGVSLIATANDVASLRGPLLDRFTVIELPPPRRQDLPVIARAIVDGMRAEMADGRWLADLDDAEMASLGAWRGGSIRPLKRAVERIVALRSDRRFAH